MIQFENAVSRYGKLILTELNDAKIICWLAGGALRDYFMGVKIDTDYDLFFPSEVEYEKCKDYFLRTNAVVIWESDNGMKLKYNGRKFDLVKKYFANPQQTIEAFDFTVSMFAVDTKKVYHGETSFIDLSKRQLMINIITYPASTISRAFRYYKKGFLMCQGEMKKMIEAAREIPKPEITSTENEEETSGDTMTFFNGMD